MYVHMCFLIFFFNYTATPEIYTYGHTLSLYAALPICRMGGRDRGGHRRAGHPAATAARPVPRFRCCMTSWLGSERDRAIFAALKGNPGEHVVRSEEHTSELQTLMRISYAVFCLKKKKRRQSKTPDDVRYHTQQT